MSIKTAAELFGGPLDGKRVMAPASARYLRVPVPATPTAADYDPTLRSAGPEIAVYEFEDGKWRYRGARP